MALGATKRLAPPLGDKKGGRFAPAALPVPILTADQNALRTVMPKMRGCPTV